MVKHRYIYLILILALLPFSATGCMATTSSYLTNPMLGADRVNFDFTTTQDTARLIINCNPPSDQVFVYYYGIKIDGKEPIRVSKFSIVSIELDAGAHKIELYSIASGLNFIYGDIFGYKTEETIQLKSKKTVAYQYVGPIMVLTKGNFKFLEEYEWKE